MFTIFCYGLLIIINLNYQNQDAVQAKMEQHRQEHAKQLAKLRDEIRSKQEDIANLEEYAVSFFNTYFWDDIKH